MGRTPLLAALLASAAAGIFAHSPARADETPECNDAARARSTECGSGAQAGAFDGTDNTSAA